MKYKFLNKGNKSNSGNHKWVKGKWYKFDDKLDMCKAGFHCSEQIIDAFSYVQGEILAEVEVKGNSIKGNDKQVWSEMKVVKTYNWTKKDSVELAIFSAELVLSNFEKKYPNDKRPREAIEAAKKVLKNDTKNNRDAAWSAARSAAWFAADSAAWSAAQSLAKKKILNKIEKYLRAKYN